MKLKEFLKDEIQSWYPSDQIQFSLLVNYIKVILNGTWHGKGKITVPVNSNTWCDEFFDVFDFDEDFTLLYGDVLEVVRSKDGKFRDTPRHAWEQPYWYAIYSYYGQGIQDESINPPIEWEYYPRYLWQPNPFTSKKQVDNIDLRDRALSALAKNAEVRVYRPKNNTNIFEGERETETLDTNSDYDYPSVKLVRRYFSELGGTYRGDFTKVGDDGEFIPVLDILPTELEAFPDDRFLGGVIKPKDFVVVRDQTNRGNNADPKWTFKRFYRCVSVGGKTDGVDFSGTIQWVADAWLDEIEPFEYLDIKKQNMLTAGVAIEILGNTRDGAPIINWTGDPGLEAFLLPVDSDDEPSVRTWEIWVSGDRAVGDEQLMAYCIDPKTHEIVQINAGVFHTDTGATIYTFDNEPGSTFALSRNLTQNIGDVLDFSIDAIVWMQTKVDAYTRAEVDQIVEDIYNHFNNKFQELYDIIYDWPNDKVTKIPRGTINVTTVYNGKGIYTHDPAVLVQGDKEDGPS